MAKKKKIENVEPSRLYLVYDESERGGSVCEGQENDEWPSYEDAYKEVHFKALYRNPPTNRFFYDSFEVSEDLRKEETLHMGVIIYSDGNTFGTTHGYWHVVGIYKTYREAEEGIQAALKGDGYKPWEGYFSSLEDDRVEILHVFEE